MKEKSTNSANSHTGGGGGGEGRGRKTGQECKQELKPPSTEDTKPHMPRRNGSQTEMALPSQ